MFCLVSFLREQRKKSYEDVFCPTYSRIMWPNEVPKAANDNSLRRIVSKERGDIHLDTKSDPFYNSPSRKSSLDLEIWLLGLVNFVFVN